MWKAEQTKMVSPLAWKPKNFCSYLYIINPILSHIQNHTTPKSKIHKKLTNKKKTINNCRRA